MDRIILPYKNKYKNACVNIFKSNIGKFFDQSELDSFIDFLDNYVDSTDYFVVFSKNKIVGCGGYYVKNGTVRLIDGMVERTIHKTGTGKFLLEYRLEAAKSKYPNKSISIDTSQHTEGFFKKYGFQATEVVKNFYGEGIDKVSMEYQL